MNQRDELTVTEVAIWLYHNKRTKHVAHDQTVRRWIRDKRLRARREPGSPGRDGGRYLVALDDLKGFYPPRGKGKPWPDQGAVHSDQVSAVAAEIGRELPIAGLDRLIKTVDEQKRPS